MEGSSRFVARALLPLVEGGPRGTTQQRSIHVCDGMLPLAASPGKQKRKTAGELILVPPLSFDKVKEIGLSPVTYQRCVLGHHIHRSGDGTVAMESPTEHRPVQL